jgi:hypothetical protein
MPDRSHWAAHIVLVCPSAPAQQQRVLAGELSLVRGCNCCAVQASLQGTGSKSLACSNSQGHEYQPFFAFPLCTVKCTTVASCTAQCRVEMVVVMVKLNHCNCVGRCYHQRGGQHMVHLQCAAIHHLSTAPADPHLHIAVLHIHCDGSIQLDSRTPVRLHDLLSRGNTTPAHCALGQLGLTTLCLQCTSNNDFM